MKFELPSDLSLERDRDPAITSIIGQYEPYQVSISDYINNTNIITNGSTTYNSPRSELDQFEQLVSLVARKFVINSDENETIYSAYNTKAGRRDVNTKKNVALAKDNVSKIIDEQNIEVEKIKQAELARQEAVRREIERQRLEQEEIIKAQKLAQIAEQKRKAEELRKAEEKRLAEEKCAKEARAREELAKEEERKRQEEAEKLEAEKAEAEKVALAQQKARELEAAAAEAAAASKSASAWTDFKKIQATFLNYSKHIVDIKGVTAQLNADPTLKKQAGMLRRKINPKFGQLSNSNAQFSKVNAEVVQHITSAKGLDIAYKWILNFVAKAIVDQAETEVPVQQNAALPLAKLAYSLLKTFPEFEYYLMARLVKKCPFIIGYTRSIDTEEGRTQMGWRKREGKWEDEVKYDERVSGIAAVWAVMCRIGDYQPQLDNFSFEASWRFLARIANTPVDLLTNTHYSIAAAWWDVAAKYFVTAYGTQSQKLMYTIVVPWVQLVQSKKFPAAARLSILGEDWLVNRNIDSIKEMER